MNIKNCSLRHTMSTLASSPLACILQWASRMIGIESARRCLRCVLSFNFVSVHLTTAFPHEFAPLHTPRTLRHHEHDAGKADSFHSNGFVFV